MKTLKSRVRLALAGAVLGTAVFVGLRALLPGLLDPPLYVAGCFLGAFLSFLSLVAPRRRSYASWLLPATGICLITYGFIAGAHLLHRARTWDSTVPTEAGGLIFWSVVATSWWLIPTVAGVLRWGAGIFAKKVAHEKAHRPSV